MIDGTACRSHTTVSAPRTPHCSALHTRSTHVVEVRKCWLQKGHDTPLACAGAAAAAAGVSSTAPVAPTSSGASAASAPAAGAALDSALVSALVSSTPDATLPAALVRDEVRSRRPAAFCAAFLCFLDSRCWRYAFTLAKLLLQGYTHRRLCERCSLAMRWLCRPHVRARGALSMELLLLVGACITECWGRHTRTRFVRTPAGTRAKALARAMHNRAGPEGADLPASRFATKMCSGMGTRPATFRLRL